MRSERSVCVSGDLLPVVQVHLPGTAKYCLPNTYCSMMFSNFNHGVVVTRIFSLTRRNIAKIIVYQSVLPVPQWHGSNYRIYALAALAGQRWTVGRHVLYANPTVLQNTY